MDKQSTIGIILIFVLLLLWMMWNSPQQKQQSKPVKQEQVKDTSSVITPKAVVEAPVIVGNSYGKYFAGRDQGNEKVITVETDLLRAELTSKGGLIRTWQLKNYKAWDGTPVQLVDYDHHGDLSILLTTQDGKVIDTKDLFFDVNTPSNHIVLDKNFEFEISFRLPASNGGQLVKTLKFRNGEYGCDVNVQLISLAPVIANFQYELAWENGIRYVEHNSVDEANFGSAFAFAGNELTEIDAKNIESKEKKEFTGSIDWIAIKNKYFSVALIPISTGSDGAYIEGTRKAMPDNGVYETYTVSLRMPFKGGSNEQFAFKLFMGPLQHAILKTYNKDLEQLMNLGWAWIIRPISEYVMLPLFTAIHYVVPNWGIVIIIFSIIIKLALHPLSKTSMESMKKMQKLQPLMNDIREKYKDDPQKMNQATMNLYKEYGVNPAGGCLPMLLQLPIMYALYAVFRSAIELRQAGFVWWIKDLSIPDIIYTLPFRIPFLGIQDISGIALLMGISMFIQQKMTVNDPRQKAMVWMMPIMMTLLFNGFPSGLNLYYAVFNVLAIGQQMLVNKKHDDEPLRKVELKKKKRGGILSNLPKLPKSN